MWSQFCRFGFSYLDKVFHINIHWPHFISLFLSISSPQFPMCSGQGTWTGHKDAGDKITRPHQPRTDSATNQLSVNLSRLFTKIIFTSDGKLYWFQENLNREQYGSSITTSQWVPGSERLGDWNGLKNKKRAVGPICRSWPQNLNLKALISPENPWLHYPFTIGHFLGYFQNWLGWENCKPFNELRDFCFISSKSSSRSLGWKWVYNNM